jgi:hypothetical protein
MAKDVPYTPPTLEEVAAAEGQLLKQQTVIEYDTKEFTIELLVKKFEGEEGEEPDIYVPHYQRAFNWDPRRQSRFIESVLIGLPIPFLFFADMADGRLEVVDGRQRLSTCAEFLSSELVLVGLERLSELDGFKFSDLPKPQQRRFKNRTIRTIVLSQNATEQDRRDLFDRINTGSLIAEPAEVRRGALPGKFTDLIDRLAKDSTFNKLCPTTEQEQREREREELVLRFFALGDGLNGYSDRISEFLDAWLKKKNAESEQNPDQTRPYEERFNRVMLFVDKHFPYGFRKNEKSKTTPRVRFDAIAVGTSWALEQKPALKPKTPVTDWLASEEFFTLTTSSAANVRSRILGRIGYVRDQLLG